MVKERAGSPSGSGPERTCASCRKQAGAESLVRWVLGPGGEVVPDLSGRSFGRGAWLHAEVACLATLPRALSKSFQTQVVTTAEGGRALLGQAAEHRASQLLGTARRQSRLALGATAVQRAVQRGDAELVVVARDAQAAADLGEVREMVRTGPAAAWGSKAQLGHLCGRPEIAVLAVLDRSLAQRLFGAIAMAPWAPSSAIDVAPGVLGN